MAPCAGCCSISGKVLEKQYELVKGQHTLKLHVPADGETGDYKLEISGSGSDWGVLSNLHTEPRLKIVFPVKGAYFAFGKFRCYFGVPRGTQAFKFTIRMPTDKRHHFAISNPDGQVAAREFVTPREGKRTHSVRVPVPVPPEHRGKL